MRTWTGFMCAAMLLLSCSGKSDGGNGSSLNLLISMREYSTPSCVEVYHQWTGTEVIGICGEDADYEKVSPVTTDGTSARCLVATAGKEELSIFGRYPFDAPITWDGKSVRYSIPTVQDGSIIPMACGVATGVPGSYSPTGLVMKPVYRVIPVRIERIPHKVKSLTIRPGDGGLFAGNCTKDCATGKVSASESTIKVLLPSPLDCREGAVIPVMVADVDLPGGLMAEIEMDNGEKTVIPDIDAYIKLINTPYTLGTSLGINSSQTKAQMQRIKDAGIEWVEVTCNSFQRNIPEAEWETRAENIRKIIADLGLKVWSCHLPFSRTLDISVLDDAQRAKNVELQKRMIRLCGEKYHPKRLVLHPSSEPISDGDRAKRLENARASIGELLPVAKEIGAVLCIENLPRTCLGRVTSEMRYLIEPYPEVMVCFDVNHLLIETHEKYFAVLGDRIGNVHISDYDRIDERHALPGDGVIDWPALHYMLRLSGYDGIFMHEVKAGKGTPAQIVERYNTVIFKNYEK